MSKRLDVNTQNVYTYMDNDAQQYYSVTISDGVELLARPVFSWGVDDRCAKRGGTM